MKKTILLILSSLALLGCNSAATQTQNTAQSNTANVNQAMQKPNDSLVVSSHQKQTGETVASQTNPNASTSSVSGGSPMQKAVDVSELTAEIDKADKSFKANPKDEKAKKALTEAYFKRAFALTDAAQYRAALGDFRKGLKLEPSNKEAKSMHDQIIEIFKSIGREPPKEGEEPAPMPVNKKP